MDRQNSSVEKKKRNNITITHESKDERCVVWSVQTTTEYVRGFGGEGAIYMYGLDEG